METEKVNNIIQFYKEQVWVSGMRNSDELTNIELKKLGETLWFARWMLSTKYKECVNSIKDILLKHFN